MNSLFDLTGKVRSRDGGSTGLGAEMSVALPEGGPTFPRRPGCFVRDRKAIKSLGRQSMVIVADLLKRESPQAIISKVVDKFGCVDILINNAGIIRRTPALDFTEKDWDEVMSINARAVFYHVSACRQGNDETETGQNHQIASLAQLSKVAPGTVVCREQSGGCSNDQGARE